MSKTAHRHAAWEARYGSGGVVGEGGVVGRVREVHRQAGIGGDRQAQTRSFVKGCHRPISLRYLAEGLQP